MNSIRRNKKWFIASLILVVIVLLSSSNSSDPDIDNSKDISYVSEPSLERKNHMPKLRGSRLLGMGITEGGVGFDRSFALAQEAGVTVIELPVQWDENEIDVKKYSEGWLPIADQFYPKTGTKIALSLNPIDTTTLRVPEDLKNKPFNDPVVIERYKAFVDFSANQLKNSDVVFISIGNEIDGYLGTSDARWQEYAEFFAAVTPHVRQKFPNAVVGSKVTYDGVINLHNNVRVLNKFADVVLVTYYPFQTGTFIVREPSTVHEDFKRITNLYPNKKIFFAEIGYPSGSLNKSSYTKQADFIKETFVAWDMYRETIPLLNFVWLHDQSKESVSEMEKYYGLEDKAFGSFLATLGLRTYDGKDKESFVVLKEELKKRGW